jgi:enoyl-CoA hydratase/carnithine racemase
MRNSVPARTLPEDGGCLSATSPAVKMRLAQNNLSNQVDPGFSLGPRQHKVWKPVVAAIQGMCAGCGQYFINECDIVICSEKAVFLICTPTVESCGT